MGSFPNSFLCARPLSARMPPALLASGGAEAGNLQPGENGCSRGPAAGRGPRAFLRPPADLDVCPLHPFRPIPGDEPSAQSPTIRRVLARGAASPAARVGRPRLSEPIVCPDPENPNKFRSSTRESGHRVLGATLRVARGREDHPEGTALRPRDGRSRSRGLPPLFPRASRARRDAPVFAGHGRRMIGPKVASSRVRNRTIRARTRLGFARGRFLANPGVGAKESAA